MTPIRAVRAAIARCNPDPSVSALFVRRVEFFIAFLAFICPCVCECEWFALFTVEWFSYDKVDERMFMRWWIH